MILKKVFSYNFALCKVKKFGAEIETKNCLTKGSLYLIIESVKF